MPWRKVICAVVLALPGTTYAQIPNHGGSKPIAEVNTKPGELNTVPLLAGAATSEKVNQKIDKSKASLSNAVSKNQNLLTPRSINATGDMYIPLAGEIGYFGKNNDYMLNYTKAYYQKNVRHFVTMQQRGKVHFKLFDRTFDKREVPLEVKYLSVIESALTNSALSPVGARGPWQFMKGTAQFMGLVVNGRVDERTDWAKSTNAAAKYMNYLYDMLGDWLLVVAAYNSGPRPVLNAIKKTGKSDFFAIKNYLPKETQNHVMAFVATATIMERMENYIGAPVPENFDWKWLNISSGVEKAALAAAPTPKNALLLKFSEEEIANMAIIKMNAPIDLDVLSMELDIDRRKVGRWNFDYFKSIDAFKDGTAKHFYLRIPKDKLEVFLEKKATIERAKIDLHAFD